jgi:hypothetical protein
MWCCSGSTDRAPAAAVLEFYRSVFAGPTVWSKHMVTNVEVEAAPRGFAARAYFQAVSRTDTTGITILGEYADLLVPDGDRLLIAEKRIDVQQTFPLAAPGA